MDARHCDLALRLKLRFGIGVANNTAVMDSPRVPVVWLAYVSYPVTTAVYLERALRRNCRVVTCGPKIGPEVIKNWHLENMKLPVVDQDIPLLFEPDMREVVPSVRGRFPDPDLYLWIESVPGHFPKNLETLTCPKACYLIDSHLNLNWHVKWAQFFDYVFVAQREYVGEFQRQGCRNAQWLPLACDPEIHAHATTPKRYDIGFVGSIFANSRRAELLQRLSDKRLLLKAERCFWDEMALLFSESRIVFNNAVRNDLNMRVFEAMSTGSFLLTDLPANSGQNELFFDGEDLGIYEDKTVVDKARHYLIHEEQREHIARRGQAMVHKAHTYSHRCAELIQVCLRGQKATPTAGEWRERASAGLNSSRKWTPKPVVRPRGRSFIIPVLDASPKGRKEFEDLLGDLTGIEGEVVAVFNSPEAAAAFKNHPRIDLSASLNVNAGVPRGWNIGIHLASQPTLFFLNADLRVSLSAVEELERALWELPAAAVVGPEGSFFGFYTYEDILWFHKDHRPSSPHLVDAISGFFFATKRELFSNKTFQFEDHYTPCFTEEWDLGLQVRQAGYRCYIVPVTGYTHDWGVSVQHGRVIPYMKNEQGVSGEILARNRIRFWRKWLTVAGELSLPGWEPNAPASDPPAASFLLQSQIVEATGGKLEKGQARPEPKVGMIENRNVFPQILNFLGLVGEGVEVGVQAGLYSEVILRQWMGRRLFSVDPWREWPKDSYQDPANVAQQRQEQLYLEAKQRLEPFKERSVILRKTSKEAAGDFADRSLDFVYLDAQHHFDAVREDLNLWFPKIKPGGILCGDDYRDFGDIRKGCGVKTAVNLFIAEQGLCELVISTAEESWFIRIA